MATKVFTGVDKPVQLVTVINDNGDGTASNSTALPPGRAAAAASVPVVLSTEDSQRPPTATVTTVASGIASVSLKAANTARKGLSVLNTDANVLYILAGTGTASATNLTVIVAATTGYWEAPFGFTGAVQGIWAADGAGSAYITEYT